MSDHESKGDELFEQGNYREAANEYGRSLRPFKGIAHLLRIAAKQTAAMREFFRRNPE